MKILVQKYGGTSVGSTERIKAVAKKIIQAQEKGNKLVVVVSAMGNTTDELISLMKQINPQPSPREYDAFISTGENVSASLLAMAIEAEGKKAISLSGAQAGIFTENIYSRAKIVHVDPVRIYEELERGKAVIVTGFQGITASADITTIGRGGSDTSAVVLAAALDAKFCEIYTDVDGVYTTDPRKIKQAKKIKQISYDEMLELASLGAKVLHPRAVEIAKEYNIELEVKSSFEDLPGTIVKEVTNMEITKPVTGVTVNDEEAMVTIFDVPDDPGIAGTIFMKLAEVNINVDMIIQSTGNRERKNNTITFTVNRDSLEQTKNIMKLILSNLQAKSLETDSNISKVSIVGVGMISKPGIAARMFKVLGDNGINIKLISTSEIKISCAINESDSEKALRILHDEFELDK